MYASVNCALGTGLNSIESQAVLHFVSEIPTEVSEHTFVVISLNTNPSMTIKDSLIEPPVQFSNSVTPL